MLKAFGAFLILFCVLSLLVQERGLGELFGASALALLAIDLLRARYGRSPRQSRMRENIL